MFVLVYEPNLNFIATKETSGPLLTHFIVILQTFHIPILIALNYIVSSIRKGAVP